MQGQRSEKTGKYHVYLSNRYQCIHIISTRVLLAHKPLSLYIYSREREIGEGLEPQLFSRLRANKQAKSTRNLVVCFFESPLLNIVFGARGSSEYIYFCGEGSSTTCAHGSYRRRESIAAEPWRPEIVQHDRRNFLAAGKSALLGTNINCT